MNYELKRILHIPRRFVLQEWGGTETVVLELSRKQKELGWQPEVVTSLALSDRRREVMDGLPIWRFPYFYPYWRLTVEGRRALDKKGGNLVSLSLFYYLLRARNVRLYHVHTLNRLAGEVRTAAHLRRKPYVVTLHGGVFDIPATILDSLRDPARKAVEWGKCLGALFGSRRVLEDADMVLCLGQAELERAKTLLGHSRIAYLPNGVDAVRFSEGDGSGFRRRHGIPDDAFLVLNISRVDAQKNQALLLQAFADLHACRPESHLVFIGPVTQPGYAGDLRRQTAELGLQSRVHWLEPVAPRDQALVDAYHACDLFVLPSLHEPFGIVVLEAWSSGKAVVASAIGGLVQLIRDGVNGLLFDAQRRDSREQLAALLKRAAASPDWRAHLGEAGRNEVSHSYDWKRVSLQLEDHYRAAEEQAKRRRWTRNRRWIFRRIEAIKPP